MCKIFPLNWENANNYLINICVTLGSFLSHWRRLDKDLFCFCLLSFFLYSLMCPQEFVFYFPFTLILLSDKMIFIKCPQTHCFFPLYLLVYDGVHVLYFRNIFVARFSSQASVLLQHWDETFIFCHLFTTNHSLAECLGDSHCILRQF